MIKQKKTHPLRTQDSFLEQKKNELLGALYSKNHQLSEQFCLDILQYTLRSTRFSEYTEKLLNQIQLIIKKFYLGIAEHACPNYRNLNLVLQKHILSSIKQSGKNITHTSFQTWEDKLDLDLIQKDLIYKTAMTFQLTSGCSNFCRRCNEWALPKVRSHFSYKAILKILSHMADQDNDEISLYGASDPLDWTQDHRSIMDIIDYFKALPMEYSLLTKVPKGKENLLKKLLKNQANLSVSVTSKNKKRIKQIERDLDTPLSKQHDLTELLIPARLDEDFMTIKPSITDGYGTEITLDGAFIILPTFTSALHPFGHKKIMVTRATTFFPKKKTGRNALLVDYFKPLEGYDLDKKTGYLTYLLDVQVESIILDNGKDELTPPGMRSLKEYLDIFEEIPRLQRKKMTRSVFKHLKKQYIFKTGFKNLSPKNKKLYLKKINAHLKLCKKTGCQSSKLSAVSFFLKSIIDYVKDHPTQTKIMEFLLKEEIKCTISFTDRIVRTPLEALLIDLKINSFDIFRSCIFCLLKKGNDSPILKFLTAHPSVYDPVLDLFVISQAS